MTNERRTELNKEIDKLEKKAFQRGFDDAMKAWKKIATRKVDDLILEMKNDQ
jgi:hypothetical protein